MSRCRICRGKLIKIIDFGKIALVGDFPKKKIKQKKYKISLNYCKICKHVQIAEILNPNLLFKEYFWETGISKSNIYLMERIIKKIKRFKINAKSKVLEIASNDGSFLELIKKKFKCFVLGIDPAKNLKKISDKKKVLSISDYFNSKLSRKLLSRFGYFDFIFARNVIAHVSNPNEIFNGVKNLLTDEGTFILEVPHLGNIFQFNQYDNIFHEHVGFHSLKSIIDLSQNNSLKIFDVEKIDSQGGSLRCYICKKSSKKAVSKKVFQIFDKEKKIGLFYPKELKKFKLKILSHINSMKNLIQSLKLKNKKISVYGASGKGQALLQFCNLRYNKIDCAYDKSKLKQGRYTPGTFIKIKKPSKLKRQNTDYLLILSWNIKDEIIKQEKKFKHKGGKFIVPFPSPRIIS